MNREGNRVAFYLTKYCLIVLGCVIYAVGFQFFCYPCGIIRKTAVEIFVGEKELLPFFKILMQIPDIGCYFLTVVAGSRIYDIL